MIWHFTADCIQFDLLDWTPQSHVVEVWAMDLLSLQRDGSTTGVCLKQNFWFRFLHKEHNSYAPKQQMKAAQDKEEGWRDLLLNVNVAGDPL